MMQFEVKQESGSIIKVIGVGAFQHSGIRSLEFT